MACEVCHKIYTPNEDNNTDFDDKPHLCGTCGLSFSLKIQLKRHVLLHADGAPYTCKNCLRENDKKNVKTYNLRLGNKNDYICDICKQSFNNKRMLLRHSIQHTFDRTSDIEESTDLKEKPPKPKNVTRKNSDKAESLNCKICGKNFSSWVSFEKHTLTHNITKSPKTLSCKLCNKAFAYQACLDKHVRKGKCNVSTTKPVPKSSPKKFDNNSLESNDKKHVCNICGKTFTRKSSLEGHELSHILEKLSSDEDKGFSDGDDKEFSDGDESDEYISQPKRPRFSTFTFQKSYTCDKCNFVCFSKHTLNKHLFNHKGKETHLCNQNNKERNSSKELTEGIISREHETECTKNPGVKSSNSIDCVYEYEKCDKDCKRKEKLQVCDSFHNKVGKTKLKHKYKEGKFMCEICEQKFHSKKGLKQHLLFHVERSSSDLPFDEKVKWAQQRCQRSKDFACDICGRRFAGETCLNKHVMKHNQEGEEKERYTDPSSVRVKKQKTIKELICEFCKEEFTGRKSAYVKHVHAHTPEVCGICDERFVDRQSLREHCKIHVGTEEGRMFMQCSQKALDAKNGLLPPEPKVEYIYLVLR